MDQNEQKLINDALTGVQDWESDMSEHFGLMNEWANAYRMKKSTKDKRPTGVSDTVTADMTGAVNALAEAITQMQTIADPNFELRSTGASEDELYPLEVRYQNQLSNIQFKRKLLKGNRGMCLFGTQAWETPYQRVYCPSASDPWMMATDFIPLSLLQLAFRSGVYDMDYSDFMAPIHFFNENFLRFATRGPEWDHAAIEEGIKIKQSAQSEARSRIENRRNTAGYTEGEKPKNELILFHGKLSDYENPLIAQMWAKYGRTDDPKDCDFTIGILNRRKIVRFHPTPYNTWHHLVKIGHYIEFELEPIAYGVGALGYQLQKDMNRITRRNHDTQTFDVYSMKFVGRGAGLKSSNLKVFPFNMIPVDNVDQIKDLRPNVDGIGHGLKLIESIRDNFRRATHASDTLQAVVTGATAREVVLAQSSDMRAVSLNAEINGDAVLRSTFQTMHRNHIDQNPYDSNFVPDLQFIIKCTTDKDYKPEHSKKLLEFLMLTTSVRQNMPLDFNPTPILKYLARSVGINPRELKEPRTQLDRTLDAMRRINGDSGLKGSIANEVNGEVESTAAPLGGISEVPNEVPTSPMEVIG